jgi:hypothetical protein
MLMTYGIQLNSSAKSSIYISQSQIFASLDTPDSRKDARVLIHGGYHLLLSTMRG